MYQQKKSRINNMHRRRQLSGKQILIMLQLNDTYQQQKLLTNLFLKKFQSHPSKNLKVIKNNPGSSQDENLKQILSQLKKYFDSGQDVYIFFCGSRINDGDLYLKSKDTKLGISYDKMALQWGKRKSSSNKLYFFIDSPYDATWHTENYQKNKVEKFAVIQSYNNMKTNYRYQHWFFLTIFGSEQYFDQNYKTYVNRQNSKYSTRKKQGEFTIKNLYNLQESIANIQLIIGYDYDPDDPDNKEPIWNSQIYRIFNAQPTIQQSKKSDFLKQKLISLAKETDEKKQQSSIPILALSQFLQRQGNKNGTAQVIFYENGNAKTKKTLDILANFSYYSRILVYEQTIKSSDYKYSFADIKQDNRRKNQFQRWFKKQIAQQYNVSAQSVQIHQLIYGSIKVKYSIKVEHNPDQSIKTHQFFKYFHLSADQFSPQGNKVYPNQKGHYQYGMIDRRGGWPYFLPVRCSRYGLNVRGNYDGGNDAWLQMDKKPGQWAIAFHGIDYPEFEKSGLKCLNAMMQGLGKDKTMFLPGPRQAYRQDKSLNTYQQIGSGIYCTPHISTAIKDYTSNGVSIKKGDRQEVYHVVLMCRINPKKIKVCTNDEYWVINQPSDIRPYGIILVKKEDKANYPSPQELFGEGYFTWKRYGDEIKKLSDQ